MSAIFFNDTRRFILKNRDFGTPPRMSCSRPLKAILISILHDKWLCLQNRRILWPLLAYRPVCCAVNNGVLVLSLFLGGSLLFQGPIFLTESKEFQVNPLIFSILFQNEGLGSLVDL
ncbi:hypothetical protein BJX63DRAFT_412117 [Aspergillus granulosus]|uniref:Uncharacterized protein n=1 Tax=Aspergillus granulosus TaxID=176169 RepID=A0ABR4GWE6_9EURO